MRRPVTERELLRGEHVVVGGDATVPFIGEAVDPPVALGVEEGKVSGERDNPIGVEWWLADEIGACEFKAMQYFEVHAGECGQAGDGGRAAGREWIFLDRFPFPSPCVRQPCSTVRPGAMPMWHPYLSAFALCVRGRAPQERRPLATLAE